MRFLYINSDFKIIELYFDEIYLREYERYEEADKTETCSYGKMRVWKLRMYITNMDNKEEKKRLLKIILKALIE